MINKYSFFSTLKNFALITLIISSSISIFYRSTNVEYLSARLFHQILTLKYQCISDDHRPRLSPNYRAFEDLLRWKPFPDVDHHVEPKDIIEDLRLTMSMANLIPKPTKCQINEQIFSFEQHQVKTFWINYHRTVSANFPERILIYLHGGAYALGDIQSYAGIECHLSRLFNLTLLHLEYRLSPEHPLPSAVHDALTLYRSLLKQNYSSSQILFMGDSAGGGLALLTIQSIIEQHLDKPRGVITLSPWTDLSASGESYERNRQRDVLLCMKKFHWLVNRVLATNIDEFSPMNRSFSPLFGSFKDFPPMFVSFGTAEVLEDDSRRIIEKAQQENIDVTVEEGEDLMHVYPIFFPFYPEAQRTLNQIQQWIQRTFSS